MVHDTAVHVGDRNSVGACAAAAFAETAQFAVNGLAIVIQGLAVSPAHFGVHDLEILVHLFESDHGWDSADDALVGKHPP